MEKANICSKKNIKNLQSTEINFQKLKFSLTPKKVHINKF